MSYRITSYRGNPARAHTRKSRNFLFYFSNVDHGYTTGLRNDLRTVVLRRCLFFILAFASQSDVFKPAMTMIFHFYASRCPLVLNWGVGADSVVSFQSHSFVLQHYRTFYEKPDKMYNNVVSRESHLPRWLW